MLNDRFIELLTKKLSDEISSDEYEEFKYLLANDAECRQHYSSFKSYWVYHEEQQVNSELLFQKVRSRITTAEQQDEAEVEDMGRRRIFTFWRSVAALLVIGTGLLLSYNYFHKNNPVQAATASLQLMHTPSRTKSKIVLSDGTVVNLNSETILKYPPAFNGSTREVYLSGEAFFEVTKDHKHPFIVHTNKMSVRVLGTAFNVKSYANDPSSETTLIRGAIEVTMADRPSDKIILKPNEKLILKNNVVNTERIDKNLTAVNPQRDTKYALTNLTYFKSNDTTIVETSWVGNKLVFKDENFGELANQMERWYGVKIKFKNDNLKDYHFTGIFEKESVLQAMSALQMIEPFHYKVKNESVYIY